MYTKMIDNKKTYCYEKCNKGNGGWTTTHWTKTHTGGPPRCTFNNNTQSSTATSNNTYANVTAGNTSNNNNANQAHTATANTTLQLNNDLKAAMATLRGGSNIGNATNSHF